MRGKYKARSQRRQRDAAALREQAAATKQSELRQRMTDARSRLHEAQADLVSLCHEFALIDAQLAPAREAEMRAHRKEQDARDLWARMHRVVRQATNDMAAATARVEQANGSFVKKASNGHMAEAALESMLSPGCETTDCDNTATCAEITTCCGESLARCQECRSRSEYWGFRWGRITCLHCRVAGRYEDMIEWRPL